MSQDRDALQRFQREARAASALNDPNICTVYDIEDEGGQPFLVMELLEGQPLKERIASGPIPAPDLAAVAIAVTKALEAAHSNGILHRDIKPANIFITSAGVPKILDFGVAKLLSERPKAPEAPASAGQTRRVGLQTTISFPGWTPGTLAYMSPEQLRGECSWRPGGRSARERPACGPAEYWS